MCAYMRMCLAGEGQGGDRDKAVMLEPPALEIGACAAWPSVALWSLGLRVFVSLLCCCANPCRFKACTPSFGT
jgi:hypothetical protein